MTATKPNWRVALKTGDRLNVVVDLRHAQGVLVRVDGDHGRLRRRRHPAGGEGPVQPRVDSHGHAHARPPAGERQPRRQAAPGLPDAARRCSNGPPRTTSPSRTSSTAAATSTSPASAAARRSSRRGQSLTFTNLDATPAIAAQQSAYHTITACKAPCTATTGIAYPLANGSVQFDSGELGYGPAGFTPAANRNTWKTPKNLKPGTYTYFCRIHPFMRGAFRVVSDKGK